MKIIITFLFLVANFSFGQTKFIVKDSLTGKPIPYVSAWANHDYIGFSSDKKGKINVRKIDINTELTFFTSSYNLKKIKIKDINKAVLLQPKVKVNKDSIVLKKEVENYLQGKDISLNLKNKFSITKSPAIVAQYLPYSIEMQDTPFISKLEFGINLSDEDVAYKIRFFNVDENLKPSTELFSEEINCVFKSNITVNGALFKKNETSNQVDLSDYKIKVPKSGVFVSIEVLDLENKTEKIRDINGKEFEINILRLLVYKDDSITQYRYQNNSWVKDESDHKIAMNIALTN